MPGEGRLYVIAGAGIAGLTLALSLAQRGATVVVLERNETLQEVGAGLQISPNARFVLDGLGLGEPITRTSMEPAALDVYRQGGREPLASLELGRLMRERFGSPYAVMHRADLADLLYKACRRYPSIDIVFGIRDWDVVSHARGATVVVDEADGQVRRLRANAFIGADGVHSRTRQHFLGGPPARFENRIAWRTLLPLNQTSTIVPTDRSSVFFGTSFHLVCYPLPHRNQLNLALFMPGIKEGQGQPHPANPGPLVIRLLQVAGSSWTPWPVYTVSTSSWHKGNIGIIGDAAHAMVPFQAQGAAMSIEDAAVLAPLLTEAENAQAAFERFEALRQPRVRKVAALSAQNGRIFHLAWPLSLARDTVMKAQGPRAHLKRLGWIYEHKAGVTATG